MELLIDEYISNAQTNKIVPFKLMGFNTFASCMTYFLLSIMWLSVVWNAWLNDIALYGIYVHVVVAFFYESI